MGDAGFSFLPSRGCGRGDDGGEGSGEGGGEGSGEGGGGGSVDGGGGSVDASSLGMAAAGGTCRLRANSSFSCWRLTASASNSRARCSNRRARRCAAASRDCSSRSSAITTCLTSGESNQGFCCRSRSASRGETPTRRLSILCSLRARSRRDSDAQGKTAT